jgi:hypothetical protein
MNRVLLLFLALSSFALADAWYEGDMFVYGDVEFMYNIFNGIAMIVQNDLTYQLGTVAVSFIMIYQGYLYTTSTMKSTDLLMNIAYAMAVFIFILKPTSTIHIYDKRVDAGVIDPVGVVEYAKVDNLPFSLVFIANGATALSNGLNEIIAPAFSTVDAPSNFGAADIGFMKQYEIMDKVMKGAIELDSSDTTIKNFKRSLDIYQSECVIGWAIYKDHTKKTFLTNPSGDLFTQITPASLGITGVSYSFTDTDGNNQVCEDYWNNNISSNINTYKEKIFTLLNNSNKDVDLNNFGSSAAMGLMATTEGVAAESIANFKTFIANTSVTKNIQVAIQQASQGAGLSGQDLANSITMSSSIAQIQAEGIGQFKFLSEMLPMAMHFLRGILYASFIFMAFMALFKQHGESLNMFKTYAVTMVGFEMMTVVLSMVQGIVNIYAQHQAADLVALYGSNLATMNNIPHYLEYLSTMSGLAGILGVAAFFMIPALVSTGNAMSAMGAIQGLVGRYKGNDIDTALQGATSQQGIHATQMAMMDKKANGQFSGDIVSGAGDIERISSLQKSVQGSAAAQGVSSITNNTDSLGQYAGGSYNNAAMQNANVMGAGASNMTDKNIMTAGAETGQVQLDSSIAKGLAMHTMGAAGSEAYLKGVENSTLTETASMTQMASMTTGGAVASGRQAANSKINQANALTSSNAYKDDGSTDYDNDNLQRGEMLANRSKLNKSMAYGKTTLTDKHGNETSDEQYFTNMQKSEALSIQQDAIKNSIMAGKTNKTNTNSDGIFNENTKLSGNKDILEATQGSEQGKIDSMIATTKAYGSAEKQAKYMTDGATAKAIGDKTIQDTLNSQYDGGFIQHSQDSAMIKSADDAGSVSSRIARSQNAGKTISDNINSFLNSKQGQSFASANPEAAENMLKYAKDIKDKTGADFITTQAQYKKHADEQIQFGKGTMTVSLNKDGTVGKVDNIDTNTRATAGVSANIDNTTTNSMGTTVKGQDAMSKRFLEYAGGDERKAAEMMSDFNAIGSAINPQEQFKAYTAEWSDKLGISQESLHNGLAAVGGLTAIAGGLAVGKALGAGKVKDGFDKVSDKVLGMKNKNSFDSENPNDDERWKQYEAAQKHEMVNGGVVDSDSKTRTFQGSNGTTITSHDGNANFNNSSSAKTDSLVPDSNGNKFSTSSGGGKSLIGTAIGFGAIAATNVFGSDNVVSQTLSQASSVADNGVNALTNTMTAAVHFATGNTQGAVQSFDAASQNISNITNWSQSPQIQNPMTGGGPTNGGVADIVTGANQTGSDNSAEMSQINSNIQDLQGMVGEVLSQVNKK